MQSLSSFVSENMSLEVVNKILEKLCSKYHVDINKIRVSTYTGKDNGYASAEKVYNELGIWKGHRTYDIVRISINQKLLSKSYDEIELTVTHEFAHVIQILYMKENQKLLRSMHPKNIKFTMYDDNEAEIQAEAFTIHELGKSRHSKVGAKDMQDYKDALQRFFDIMK